MSEEDESEKLLQCWEFMQCGRQPGGTKAAEKGICPASTETRVDGLNQGINGGRVCWALGSTLCGGQVQGAFFTKKDCLTCEFFRKVTWENRKSFASVREVQARFRAEHPEEK